MRPYLFVEYITNFAMVSKWRILNQSTMRSRYLIHPVHGWIHSINSGSSTQNLSVKTGSISSVVLLLPYKLPRQNHIQHLWMNHRLLNYPASSLSFTVTGHSDIFWRVPIHCPPACWNIHCCPFQTSVSSNPTSTYPSLHGAF